MMVDSNSDPRLQQINEWLTSILSGSQFRLEVASSDASFRRYFRVYQQQHSQIVMDAPPEHENLEPFIKIAEFLLSYGIPVPQIFAQNREQGFLLLSDLGHTSYLSILDEHCADHLYRTAIDEIIKMQLTPASEIRLAAYDKEKLHAEMSLFPDWFLRKHLSITPPPELDSIFELLIRNACEQPQYFVHRDYHSRNLMLKPDNQVAIIDFQDAVMGPVTYDLVSLLRDCYILWPHSRIDDWLDYYFEQATIRQLLVAVDKSVFIRWFDLMGLQRHLKVLGIFCRLNYRDKKAGYMNDLSLTLKYVLQVTERYPELAYLHQFLTQSSEIMAIQ